MAALMQQLLLLQRSANECASRSEFGANNATNKLQQTRKSAPKPLLQTDPKRRPLVVVRSPPPPAA
jgi:hypothetical protein